MTTLIDGISLTQLLCEVLGQSRDLVSYCVLREAMDYAVVSATLTNPVQKVVIKLAGPQAALAPGCASTPAEAAALCHD